MDCTLILTPITGDKRNDMDAAKRAVNYYRLSTLALSPVLAFSNLESDDWLLESNSKDLLEICTSVAVFTDEVTEMMIRLIKKAQKKELPIRFYDADRKHIDYDALVINQRIGPGYRKIIAEANGETCCSGICPYGSERCRQASEKTVTETGDNEKKPEKTETPVTGSPLTKKTAGQKKSLLQRLFGRH